MITKADIVARVQEWQLTPEVVEKDYVLGWLLWGISTDPVLSQTWVFKGGTCLKKCYIETYRFSEELDFSVLPNGPYRPDDVDPLLRRTLARIEDASGISMVRFDPYFKLRPGETSVEGRVYYIGPRQTPAPAKVKLDLTGDEPVVRPPVLQSIAHPYPDTLPGAALVRCYSFEEVFAEKLRAMAQRGRPRDLYDIINLFWRDDLRLYPEQILHALQDKCAARNVVVPTADSILSAEGRLRISSEWQDMLAHQLPQLPPIEPYLNELTTLFGWLHGTVQFEALGPPRYEANEDETWSPPATVYAWNVGVPVETVRFAATNRLLVDLRYHGTNRLIEPYSLRRTRDGHLLLHAERADGGGHRSYRVDQIESLQATSRPFRPRIPIEFSSRGPLHAPLQRRSSSMFASPSSSSAKRRPMHVYRCIVCQRDFEHTRRNAVLGKHKNSYGGVCSGRRGTYITTRD